jgi:hypothetical protein
MPSYEKTLLHKKIATNGSRLRPELRVQGNIRPHPTI